MWTHDRYVLDTRLQLGYEEFVRPLSMGTNWQSLRIGIRFAINDSARVAISNWALVMGVCQGNTSLLAASTTDWIGGGMFGAALPAGIAGGVTNAFAAGPPNTFSVGSAANVLWKNNVSFLYGSATASTTFYVGTGAGGGYGAQNMSHIYVDILKGSPNYTITPYYVSTALIAQTHITDIVFRQNMEATTPTTSLSSAGAKTLAYTGSGLFDTLSIAHFKSWPHIEIDSIWVVRLT